MKWITLWINMLDGTVIADRGGYDGINKAWGATPEKTVARIAKEGYLQINKGKILNRTFYPPAQIRSIEWRKDE